MKKIYILFIIFFILVLILISIFKNNIKTTNLNNIFIDSIKIGDSLDKIDLSNYNLSNKFLPEKDTIHYSNLSVTFNENKEIIKISANLFNGNNMTINNTTNFFNIKEIINILGEEYICNWYDFGQRLRQIIYIDKENYLKANFIFDDVTGKLVKIIVSNEKEI